MITFAAQELYFQVCYEAENGRTVERGQNESR